MPIEKEPHFKTKIIIEEYEGDTLLFSQSATHETELWDDCIMSLVDMLTNRKDEMDNYFIDPELFYDYLQQYHKAYLTKVFAERNKG